jgi:hypothetical protein
MFERFVAQARRVVVLSQEEARSHRHSYIGTEHLLLGIIGVPGNIACTDLESQGVDLTALRGMLDEIIGTGAEEPRDHIPFTPRAKKALELTLREALQLGHNYIGPEHILLGLLREGEGVAAQVLVRFGVDLHQTREGIGQLVNANPDYMATVQGQVRANMTQAPAAGPEPTQPPKQIHDDSPLGRWAQAHALSAIRPEAVDAGSAATDVELRAVVAGLPLLARVGIVVPLALLLDLVRLTGGYLPADTKLRALAGQPGVMRLRALAWPPGARVALAGLLSCDLPYEAKFISPDASLFELRGALIVALGGTDLRSLATSRELRELDEKIDRVRREKEACIDARDFEKAAALRDSEKELLAQRAARARDAGGLQTAGRSDGGNSTLPVGATPGWQASGEVFDVLTAAAGNVTEATITMLEILGAAAAAADPTLPVKMRHRISSLPRIGTRERRLIMETVTMSTRRSDVTGMTRDFAAGTTGVSHRGRITGLVPTQLALPGELIAYRHACQELLYRVSEAETEFPPAAVTLVLDTTPATYGPPELVLRLVAHVIAVTMWKVRKSPALVSLDRPGLARQVGAPSDLINLWTARSLEPPDMRAALSTARRLNAPAILLTEHHAARDLGVVPHRALRLLTTHVADDLPPAASRNPFHIHLPPNPTSVQVVRAVRDLLEPNANSRAS